MNSLAKRAARAVVLLGVVTAAALVPTAAHAEANYTCASGYTYDSPIQILGPYGIYGESCTGGNGDDFGLVTIPPGSWPMPTQETFYCHYIYEVEPGTIMAHGCQ
ncbi:hypothetical protein [Sphaerisporangium sp. TRM90804]|uniref:hypothetical protein n=1 Tax=Sphaerisporangium sp. TRM90804 TaxID=3031113 RepID=UPI00244A01E2|nr:hypothetical protein [Sphaerisporangium sp. TRM90804]MDH2430743.1 hypothetical protein [Sphaerisporangium sp. TRM90804]